MPPRKGQKNRFPVNRFLAIKRNQDVQLACALVKDKEYVAKAKKIKRLESKAKLIADKESQGFQEKAFFSNNLKTRRQLLPTVLSDQGQIAIPGRSGRRRQNETLEAAKELHGASSDNMSPAYEGLAAVLNSKASVAELFNIIKKCKKIRDKAIPMLVKGEIKNFEKSLVNFVRSVNILYKLGWETLCIGLDEERKVNGKYRDLQELLILMAKFYLTVNKQRKDKLDWFGEREGTFKVAIGGDGAPFGKDDQALAWLVSFLNCGKRVCSSGENFLLFGANCSEDCEPVSRCVTMLKGQMTQIEKKTYPIQVNGKEVVLSFKFELLPNDMKYLAFLAGELSISPSYFSPFADVKKDDINSVQGTFGQLSQNKWHPWKYSDRIRVAAAVEKKKVEVSKTNLKPSTKREKITSFISQQKSRQEFPPLVGNFIDKAKAEPLHLKNNAWQQWNSFVLKYALSRTDLRNCDTVFEVPTNSCFGKYYHCIRFMVIATRLAKKIRKWFADDRTRNKQLEYRFTGKESRLFCHNFMSIVEGVTMDDDQQSHTFKLHVFAYTGINLRDAVSLFSRVTISSEQIQSLSEVCSNFFRASALFLSATPTSWTIGHIVPAHARQIHQSLGMGLGVNTMEGREAKHIALAKFTRNTQFSNRWLQVFRHEYVSLVWLRENGCDEIVHKETSGVYIPKRCYSDQFCHCGQPKQAHNEKCTFCSAQLRRVVSECVIQRKITNDAKAVYN
ncbi:hypothetical protein P5673_014329 [Acropora cervicornis]|uniref:Uncharacterized protein n=1 Tax=Acropora cervicornis TaxID=6130 RepID=A0AAD9V637_ACRCE|nr:hypothetical protein P5673_014329 [Acropora cervicornis]